MESGAKKDRGRMAMEEYTIVQQYALIGLDGTDSIHKSVEKSAVLRGVRAGYLLEELMVSRKHCESDFAESLEKVLHEVKSMGGRALKAVEQEITAPLKISGALDQVPDLLGCDMYYYTAGVELKVYRSDQEEYQKITETLRAEVLEEGELTEESILLLWLIRESGFMHEIFSQREQGEVEQKIVSTAAAEKWVAVLWAAEFHKAFESLARTFIRKKNELFKNPYLEGMNIMYPFLDRRQAVFIDFVVFGTTVSDRRMAAMSFLCEHGHFVEEVKNGTETLLKIDNIHYRIVPKTVTCRGIPIQGAVLSPVYG